jgi:hypothetical protein
MRAWDYVCARLKLSVKVQKTYGIAACVLFMTKQIKECGMFDVMRRPV